MISGSDQSERDFGVPIKGQYLDVPNSGSVRPIKGQYLDLSRVKGAKLSSAVPKSKAAQSSKFPAKKGTDLTGSKNALSAKQHQNYLMLSTHRNAQKMIVNKSEHKYASLKPLSQRTPELE